MSEGTAGRPSKITAANRRLGTIEGNMLMPVFTLLTLSALLLGGCGNKPDDVADHTGSGLTIVELYQSQGCSSCPPAIRNVNALADRNDILALTFSVTYWDYLGWKDTEGKAAFTHRQRDYANRNGSSRVYTPQIIVNGKAMLVGNQAAEIDAAIERSGQIARLSASLSKDNSVTLAPRPDIKGADVWLVHYDPASRNIPIRAGENAGRTIAHRNIVIDIGKIGTWNGDLRSLELPPASSPGLSSALLVQQGSGGPLLAAAKL